MDLTWRIAPNIEYLDRQIAELDLLGTAANGGPVTISNWMLARIVSDMRLMRDELSEFRWIHEQQHRRETCSK